MSIKSIRGKKWLTVAVVIGMIAAGPGRYLFLRYESDLNPWYREHQRWANYRAGTGLEHDLAVRNIKAGDTVESLQASYPNLIYETLERWTLIRLHGGISYENTSLLAVDGKLISATRGGCTYSDVFFNRKMSDRDQEEFNAAWKEHNHRIMVRIRDKFTLMIALAGVAANTKLYDGGNYYFPDVDNPPRD